MSALVNGKFFDWGDITISLLPLTPVVFSAREISYQEEVELDVVYGKGNWKAQGTMSLLKSEFEALAFVTPDGILNLDPRLVTINILFSNSFEGSVPFTTETLTGVRFTKISDKATQNEKSLVTSLDFMILGNIHRNGKAARGL
ncbi:MAG: hypothetical protein ACRCTJ_02230 [Brevinema sp.]